MAKSTPVEYEDRNGKVKALREADLIGSSYDARSHGVNTVDLSHSIREPGFSFDANMAGFVIRHDADKAKGSHARGKEKDEAVPRDRPQDDDKRYLAEEVGNARHPRPSPEHLLSKYEQPYDRHRRYDDDDEGYRRFGANRREGLDPRIVASHPRCTNAIRWDGDEVEVVHADDSVEISTAGMGIWEASGQEPLSGINLDDCERIDVTKNGVAGPGAAAARRREGSPSSSGLSWGPVPGKVVVVVSSTASSKEGEVTLPVGQRLVVLDQVEKSWLGSSPASMARRMLAA
ncbi:hypothetical protein QYE76_030162 [Lolium multiflorum]|uniref:Uncharacterized protein n=1 Tax=Lolium multiflorum TaxID=4521 RepID=A0AAD8QR24_LOLMU|nr:hypothetical protein QYE76_030162 [Lolium multiflorum]